MGVAMTGILEGMGGGWKRMKRLKCLSYLAVHMLWRAQLIDRSHVSNLLYLANPASPTGPSGSEIFAEASLSAKKHQKQQYVSKTQMRRVSNFDWPCTAPKFPYG